MYMLVDKFPIVPRERTLAAEPFVGDDTEGILITGERGFSLQLFRRHIRRGTSSLLQTEQFRRGSKQGEAKVAEQDVLVEVQQDVLWLDIAMDDATVMSVLESSSYLLNVGYRRREWEARPYWVTRSRRIVLFRRVHSR